MFGRANAELESAKHEIARLKAILEVTRSEKDHLKAENERLLKLLDERPGDIASMLDELMNGSKEDRMEVQPWNRNR